MISEFSPIAGVSKVAVTRRTRRLAGRLALVFVGTMSFAGCTKIENVLASIPIFGFLRESPAFDPYEAPRPAPPGAVPYESPAGEGALMPRSNSEVELIAFGAPLRNIYQPGDSAAMRLGDVMFERHCAVCHGPAGKGDGPIIGPGKFPFAPDVTLPVSVNRTDGYLYGIIAAGRGLMPAYGPRMNHSERWATVLYLRSLQGQQAGAPATPAPAPAAPGQTPGQGR